MFNGTILSQAVTFIGASSLEPRVAQSILQELNLSHLDPAVSGQAPPHAMGRFAARQLVGCFESGGSRSGPPDAAVVTGDIHHGFRTTAPPTLVICNGYILVIL